MHAQTSKQCTKSQTSPTDWELANFPKLQQDKSEYDDDNWHLGSTCSLKGKCEHSAVLPKTIRA